MPISRRTFTAALAITGACSKPKRTIVVGSKNTTEQTLFGEIIALYLERRLDRPAERRLSLPGTRLAHDTLIGRGIDLYVEYSAAAYGVVLRETPSTDPVIAVERLKQEYRRTFLCEWLDPLGVDSAFVVAASKALAESGKLATLSDAAEDKNGFRFASSIEFQERQDGMAALSAYRLYWRNAPKVLENERMYRQLSDGLIDLIGVNRTDGRLQKVPHTILADDKKIFLPQLASIVVRQDALAAEPTLQKHLSELSGKFNNGQMQDWNYQVDVIRRPAADVAKEFLKVNG